MLALRRAGVHRPHFASRPPVWAATARRLQATARGQSWVGSVYRSPPDFFKAGAVAINLCNNLLGEITTAPPISHAPDARAAAVDMLHRLDALSNTICQVLDAAECCRNMHASSEWVHAAEGIYGQLSHYMFQLNACRPVYEALAAVTRHPGLMMMGGTNADADAGGSGGALSPEERRMAVLLRREFERDGIHLHAAGRGDLIERVIALNSEVATAGSAFTQGNRTGTGTVTVPAAPLLPLLTSLRNHASAGIRLVDPRRPLFGIPSASAGASAAGGRTAAVDLHPHTVSLVAQHCGDAETRRVVVCAAARVNAPNEAALASLRDTRTDLARTIGFRSYAHMVARDRMAGSPEAALSFLQQMSRAIAPRAARELVALHATRDQHEAMVAAASPAAQAPPAATAVGSSGGGATASSAAAAVAVDGSFEQRVALLRDRALTGGNGSGTNAPATAGSGTLQAWDIPFYKQLAFQLGTHRTMLGSSMQHGAPSTGQLAAGAASNERRPLPLPKQQPWYTALLPGGGSSSADGVAAAGAVDIDIAAYMTLPNVLWGLRLITRRVFGLELAFSEASSSETGGAHVLRVEVSHESEGHIGTIYLDLFARPHRNFAGAAHFVVRCGKQGQPYDSLLEQAMSLPPQTLMQRLAGTTNVLPTLPPPHDASLSDAIPPPVVPLPPGAGSSPSAPQKPILCLLTSFSMDGDHHDDTSKASTSAETPLSWLAGSDGDDGGGLARLTGPLAHQRLPPACVETLYHEFGHAMHSLLSRSSFQHMSGTRGPLDFVEVPSHVFEYWCRDYRVVSLWARHPATGAPLPEAVFAAYLAERRAFRALELQECIVQSLVDLAIHGDAALTNNMLQGGLQLNRLLHDPRLDVATHVRTALQPLPRAGAASAAAAAARDASKSGRPHHDVDAWTIDLPVRHDIETGKEPPMQPLPPLTTAERSAWHRTNVPSLAAAIAEQYAFVPPVPQSHAHAGLMHLFTYGGGYYAYMYATVFSSLLWRRLFHADPLSRASGEAYRRLVLEPGGSVDAAAILATAVNGDGLSMQPLIDELQ